MNPYRLKSGNEGWLTSYADLITNLLIFFILIVSTSEIQTSKMEKIAEALSDQKSSTSLSAAAEKVQQSLKEQNLDKEVAVKLTDDGLEISFNSGVTFASGSAAVLPSVEHALSKVFEVIRPYTDRYHIAVEGHTDERPIKSDIYRSNWELSSARAMEIRSRLESTGIDYHKLRVEAYADTKPLDQKDKAKVDRETLLAQHRRVVIRLF